MKIDSPKIKKSDISEMKIGESIMINEKHSQFNNQPQNTSIWNNDIFKPAQQNIPKNSSSYSF